MPLDDAWARDFQRRMNERLSGMSGGSFFRGPTPEYAFYDEAFGNIGHPGKYRDAYGNPRYGPPHLARIYRCVCGASEADHDDNGNAYGIGAGCAPRAHDELKEQIRSWL